MSFFYNKANNKILFDATYYDGNEVVNKIYLIDLNTSKEEVLLQPNDIFENSNVFINRFKLQIQYIFYAKNDTISLKNIRFR